MYELIEGALKLLPYGPIHELYQGGYAHFLFDLYDYSLAELVML